MGAKISCQVVHLEVTAFVDIGGKKTEEFLSRLNLSLTTVPATKETPCTASGENVYILIDFAGKAKCSFRIGNNEGIHNTIFTVVDVSRHATLEDVIVVNTESNGVNLSVICKPASGPRYVLHVMELVAAFYKVDHEAQVPEEPAYTCLTKDMKDGDEIMVRVCDISVTRRQLNWRKKCKWPNIIVAPQPGERLPWKLVYNGPRLLNLKMTNVERVKVRLQLVGFWSHTPQTTKRLQAEFKA